MRDIRPSLSSLQPIFVNVSSLSRYAIFRRSLLIATISLSSPTITMAESDDPITALGASGIAPASDQWFKFKPKMDQSSLTTLSEDEIKDPKKLLAFLKERPESLDPSKMTPFIAIEVGQTLLYGGEVRRAITLLDKAREKWPSQPQLLQTWARALVKMGAPSYARIGIERWREQNPTAQVEGYTQYLYALCIYLEGPEDSDHLRRTIELVSKLVTDEPQYIGPDGVSAAQLLSFIEELRGRLKSRP